MARMTMKEKLLERRINRLMPQAIDRIQIPILKLTWLFNLAKEKASEIPDDDKLVAEIRYYAQKIAA